MKASRKIIYGFLTLPHYKQLDILLGNELITREEVAAVPDHDAELALFTEGFKRAKEQDKLDAVVAAIESAVFDREQEKLRYNTPLAPPKPKFTVTPHKSYDKRIEINGPDGLRFFIDNDDVNQKVVVGQMKYLLDLLEKQWSYTPPDSDYENDEDDE